MPQQLAFDPKDQQLLTFLQKTSLLQSLSLDEIGSLAALIQKYSYQQGETVFVEGDSGENAYIIHQGQCCVEKMGRIVKLSSSSDIFGEVAMLDSRPRTATVRCLQPCEIFAIPIDFEKQADFPAATAAKIYKQLGKLATSYLRDTEALYREIDVLLVQDGGCAPGYNPITAFLTEHLEKAGRQVFIAAEGLVSLVQGHTEDYRCLIYKSKLFKQLEHIPGVIFSPPLRDARGANFRSERYKQFIDPQIQQQAVANILARKMRVIIGIGGNGTFQGINALSRLLPQTVQVLFVPVTIDSDISGTECIGQHTGIEVGAEKIRCYMADARTHHRCYIIEMMGALGGFHAMHSCLGAGAHLAVLPSSQYDPFKVAEAIKDRDYTVIVVAEGYKYDQRKAKGFSGNAAEYFHQELIAANLETKQRVITESFSRDIRGAAPNNMDITLAQRMARKLTQLVIDQQTRLMPAIVADKEYSIPFCEIQTDNSVESGLARLANRLGV